MIRVVIADDQVLFCSGIEMLIASQDDLDFAGAAYDGEAITVLAAQKKPDVILMDIRMPKVDGITATEQILAAAGLESPRIIVLTTHQRDIAVLSAINAGASGFLMKDATPEFLLAAIRTVHAGKSVIAPNNSLALIHDLSPRHLGQANDAVISALSVRQKEVFLLAARGLSNADIGAAAFISETTVKSHISGILAKLGLSSRLQLVALAYENRLVQ
ncbi:response regulator [Cryobacterium luteum]|uniref:Response regulator transcription factor n=1 Tax=Cryobacterium luteum TaxID=1424661 RepID=A0A1H8L8Y7_9MICO|nr:response regulator transcription factor [Cryobacterium luteum]TFB94452.1 response regulator transcription factor [Cryobacterium luteum]SEO01595.1 two component transcriptional regulator, LuxR family [Cryobacterium luteum]